MWVVAIEVVFEVICVGVCVAGLREVMSSTGLQIIQQLTPLPLSNTQTSTVNHVSR